jgi:hypothetical protein
MTILAGKKSIIQKRTEKNNKYISLDYDESSSYDENILSPINNKGQVKKFQLYCAYKTFYAVEYIEQALVMFLIFKR